MVEKAQSAPQLPARQLPLMAPDERVFAEKALPRQPSGPELPPRMHSLPSIGEGWSARSLLSDRSYRSRRTRSVRSVGSMMTTHVRRVFTWQWVASKHYFFCYAAYLVTLGILGMLCLYASGLPIKDAGFMSVSSITMAGLSSVDLPASGWPSQLIVLLLIVLASPMVCSLGPVLLRLHAFRKHGLKDLPEARALRQCGGLVAAYWCGMQLLGFALLRGLLDGDPSLARQGVDATWASLFLAVSAFQNNGLLVMSGSLVAFDGSAPVLAVTGALIIAGNVGFPILLRGLVVALHRVARTRDSPSAEGWEFLLERPRKCYTHLFPHAETVWLTIVLVALVGLQMAAMYWHDGRQARSFVSSLFCCVTTRTAGINAIDYGELSPATGFIVAVCMYISATPIYVAVRYTQEDVIEGLDGDDDEELYAKPDIIAQTRSVMNDHATGLVVLVFLLCAFEEQGVTAGSHVWFLDVVFEVASAYGTVGLTRGTRAAPNLSMSGAWGRPAQLCVILIMFCGRCRGLPLSIDPSVQRPTDFELSMSCRSAQWPRRLSRPGPLHGSGPYGSDLTLVQGSHPDLPLPRVDEEQA